MSKNLKRSQAAPQGGTVSATTTESKSNKEKENKMSTVEPTTEKVSETIKKTYKGFNLDTLEEVSIEKEFEFTPAANPQEAIQRLGSDQKVILAALNSALKSQALVEGRKEALGPSGASKKIVLDAIKTYRLSPMFSTLVTVERGKPGWRDQYGKQTRAILEQVSKVPFIMENIKAMAAAATSDDDDSDE